jgi:tetratricopeptide (TPR) repeat protein
LTQIDSAIEKDRTKSVRSLHHTRGLVLGELAVTEENGDIARKWLAQSEREFLHCIASKESDEYGHTGLANLYVQWSGRKKISDEEATEYLEKAESVISQGLKVVRDRASLLITSAEIEKDLGHQPARLSKLRQAVESNSASMVGRYLLGRAYRQQGEPRKTMEVLEPVIRTDFGNVRAYVEYTRAMLQISEPVKRCVATLSQCKVDGESDPAYIGLYGGLLFMDGRYAEAKKLWDAAGERRFPYDERMKRQYTPRDSDDPARRPRFTGTVQHVKPGYVLVNPIKDRLLSAPAPLFRESHWHTAREFPSSLHFPQRDR